MNLDDHDMLAGRLKDIADSIFTGCIFVTIAIVFHGCVL